MNRFDLASMSSEPLNVFILVGHHDKLLYGSRQMHSSFADHLNSLMMFQSMGLVWMLEGSEPGDYQWVPIESQLGGHSLRELAKLGDRQLNKSDRLNV